MVLSDHEGLFYRTAYLLENYDGELVKLAP